MNIEFITAQQAAKRWTISDRRIRVLCKEGKISGAVKEGKSYKIPKDAMKPADSRSKSSQKISITRWLKWDNDVIGTIDRANTVNFTKPEYNKVSWNQASGKIHGYYKIIRITTYCSYLYFLILPMQGLS